MTDDQKLALAMRIRLAREKKQLTQEQLAKLIGASQQSVGAWEVGRQQPRGLVRVHRLSEVLEIPISELAKSAAPAVLAPAPVKVTAESYDAAVRDRAPRMPEVIDSLRDALPDQLKAYAGVHLTSKSGQEYLYSYISPKCVISVLEPDEVISGIMTNTQPRLAIYKEMLARRHLNEGEPNHRHYAVIFVHNGPGGLRVAQGLVDEAGIANVEIEVHYSYADAAKRIAELEILPTQADIAFLVP